MHKSFVDVLALQLNVAESEAEQRLQAIAGELARALGESEQVEIPSVGRFIRSNGSIVFEPDDALLRAVNLDVAGLGSVTLPGRPDAASSVPPVDATEAGAVDDAPSFIPEDEAGREETTDAPERAHEQEMGSALEARLEAESEPDFWLETETDVEPGPDERLADPEIEDERTDPVAYWNEEAFDEDEVEEIPAEEATFHEEETDERFLWHSDSPEMPLSPVLADDEMDDVGFAEVSDDAEVADEGPALPDPDDVDDEPSTDQTVIAPVMGGHIDLRTDDPPELDSTAAQHPAARADRPPERHAEPKPVREPHATRRRSLAPILLIGFLLLAGLAAAAYFYLRPDTDSPSIAQQQPTTPAPTGVASDDADDPGGLADSVVTPPVGTPEETVAEAEELAETATPPAQVQESAPEPTSAPSAPAAPASTAPPIDVSAGGWTIVVGSATSAEDAQRIAARFRQQGHDAAVLYGAYGGVTRYRVVIRQFPSENEAIAFLRDAPDGFPTDAWRMRISSGLEVIPR